MPESITRRSFIKGSTALGVTSVLGTGIDGGGGRPHHVLHGAGKTDPGVKIPAGSRFTRQGNRQSMVGRKQEFVVVKQTGRYIAIVIGQNEEKVKATSDRLVEKLKGA